MFKICFGGTRFVLLTSSRAYKIGRVRPIKLLVRLAKIQFSLNSRERFYRLYGHTTWLASWRYVFAGYYANRNELSYQENDQRVLQLEGGRLWGWVVLQERVDPVPENLRPECVTEGTCFPRDYGLTGGSRVVLIDYGDERTIFGLRGTL